MDRTYLKRNIAHFAKTHPKLSNDLRELEARLAKIFPVKG